MDDMRLLFNNPTMREGLNITVRRGDKWLGYRGAVEVAEREDSSTLFEVWIVHTMEVEQFNDLAGNDQLLRLEHDPKCHTFEGLWNAMLDAYQEFSSDDSVTVVFFTAPTLKG